MSAPTETSESASPKKKRVKTPRPDEMKAETLEFINAIDEYKRVHERPFPTWTEIFEIVIALGYRKEEE
ncbi:MAG: hypothetical protein AAF368_03040 [Planctomycetota bacterium]